VLKDILIYLPKFILPINCKRIFLQPYKITLPYAQNTAVYTHGKIDFEDTIYPLALKIFVLKKVSVKLLNVLVMLSGLSPGWRICLYSISVYPFNLFSGSYQSL
jgi:hypothetical protein